MPNQQQWDEHWLKIAEITSQLSKDPSTKVGAVVVTPDNRQCSLGYNGFAAGIEETPEIWNDRPVKYEMVIHGEINAILNCPFPTKGCTVYVTHQPCHRCMPHLRNAGIERVVYAQEYPRLQHRDIWLKTAMLFKEVKHVPLQQHV